jgi:hypothetical protein
VRRLYFVKPDVLIMVDEIETDRERRLELRFHPEHPWEKAGERVLVARGPNALLRTELLTPEGVSHRWPDRRDRSRWQTDDPRPSASS